MDNNWVLTKVDNLGRNWTMICDRCPVGFQYHLYLYRGEVDPLALEMLHPGGVAHGWTDEDPEDAGLFLAAMMAVKVRPPTMHSSGYGAGYAAYMHGYCEPPDECLGAEYVRDWNAGMSAAISHHEEKE